jgi:hypothetical protein
VSNQVSAALTHFGRDVQAGQLTVVGAVYDFRNDLMQGAGKLVIVNVNGNSEPGRMSAFVEAISSNGGPRPAAKETKGKRAAAPAFDNQAAAREIAAQLAKLRSPAPGLAVHAKSEAQAAAPHD